MGCGCWQQYMWQSYAVINTTDTTSLLASCLVVAPRPIRSLSSIWKEQEAKTVGLLAFGILSTLVFLIIISLSHFLTQNLIVRPIHKHLLTETKTSLNLQTLPILIQPSLSLILQIFKKNYYNFYFYILTISTKAIFNLFIYIL